MLDELTILTAAHCVDFGYRPFVLVGRHDLNKPPDKDAGEDSQHDHHTINVRMICVLFRKSVHQMNTSDSPLYICHSCELPR